MRPWLITSATTVAIIYGFAMQSVAQELTATVRTHQGNLYRVMDPSLEVDYTIGEPREKKEETPTDTSTTNLNITTSMGAPGGSEAQPPGGEEKKRIFRGHAREAEFVVLRGGVESHVAWERVRAMLFRRVPVLNSGLPPYIAHYRYSVSVTTVDGEQIEADYVNLGTATVRGETPAGRVDIPWEEIQSVIFER